MADINININIDSEGEPNIVKKERKLKNGKETVLELPERTESGEKPKGILQMMGI